VKTKDGQIGGKLGTKLDIETNWTFGHLSSIDGHGQEMAIPPNPTEYGGIM
jgi:hypothetical protein